MERDRFEFAPGRRAPHATIARPRHEVERAGQAPAASFHLGRPALTAGTLSVLQRQAGNRAVQRLLSGAWPAVQPEERAAAPGGMERSSGTSTIFTGEGDEQETRTATRTADPRDAGVGGSDAGGSGSGASTCKRVSGTLTVPKGTLTPRLSGGMLSAHWTMAGDFASDPADPAVCGPCGEYRQYVRGKFTKNGSTVTHRLCGKDLDPTSYEEDCARVGGTDYKYGYHSIPFATSKFSRPDQATGQRWDGEDAPGISGSSGDKLAMKLDFLGYLKNPCSGATLDSAAWSVSGSATVP